MILRSRVDVRATLKYQILHVGIHQGFGQTPPGETPPGRPQGYLILAPKGETQLVKSQCATLPQRGRFFSAPWRAKCHSTMNFLCTLDGSLLMLRVVMVTPACPCVQALEIASTTEHFHLTCSRDCCCLFFCPRYLPAIGSGPVLWQGKTLISC
jgi:hypothetical protein